MKMLEQKIREAIIPPKLEHPTITDIRIMQAVQFAFNVARKADERSKMLIAIDYLQQNYGYAVAQYPERFDRR